jgi:predicted aspartyl protease
VHFDVGGFQMQDWAYADTGFEGFLMVTELTALSLGVPDLVSTWELGDGSLTQGADYLGEIEICGLNEKILGQITCLGNEWIIGLGVLKNFEVIFNHGQKLEIRP